MPLWPVIGYRLHGGERLLGCGPFLEWDSARSHQQLQCSSWGNKVPLSLTPNWVLWCRKASTITTDVRVFQEHSCRTIVLRKSSLRHLFWPFPLPGSLSPALSCDLVPSLLSPLERLFWSLLVICPEPQQSLSRTSTYFIFFIAQQDEYKTYLSSYT